MAFDLLDANPFPTKTFGQLDTDRPGFTFDPNMFDDSFTDWKKNFLDKESDLVLNLKTPNLPSNSVNLYDTSGKNWLDSFGDFFMDKKEKAKTDLKMGYALKTAGAVSELFNNIITYSRNMDNITRQKTNKKQSLQNQMTAIDNQVLAAKNQIADKFAQTMSRNAVTLAAKNLRVTASSLLEKTKDAAYDATKDIEMMKSNAELKKIALRSESKQADVANKLSKSLLSAQLMSSLAKTGLMVATSASAFGSLGATESLQESVYDSNITDGIGDLIKLDSVLDMGVA